MNKIISESVHQLTQSLSLSKNLPVLTQDFNQHQQQDQDQHQDQHKPGHGFRHENQIGDEQQQPYQYRQVSNKNTENGGLLLDGRREGRGASRISSLSGNKEGRKVIKIKAEEIEKPKQQQIKQCRICLEGQEQGRMVRPCVCSGSITYAHQKCLIQWIKRKHDSKQPKHLLCEMCNSTINYRSNKNRTFSLQQFCKNYNKQKFNFITFYIFIAVILLTILGLIFIVVVSDGGGSVGERLKAILVKNENMRIIYICVVFILVIVLMFLVILFLIQYAVKTQLVITQVYNYGTCGGTNGIIGTSIGKKKMKIHPKVSEQNQETQTLQGNNINGLAAASGVGTGRRFYKYNTNLNNDDNSANEIINIRINRVSE